MSLIVNNKNKSITIMKLSKPGCPRMIVDSKATIEVRDDYGNKGIKSKMLSRIKLLY